MKPISLENNSQRIFLVATIIFIVVGLFLHNPLGGYNIPLAEYVTTPCSDSEKATYKKQLEELKRSGIRLTDDPAKDEEYIKQSVRECINLPSDTYGPLAQWRSAAPIVGWFGSVVNVITYLMAVFVVGASGIAIFREEKGS